MSLGFLRNKFTPRQIALMVVALAALVALAIFYRRLDVAALHEQAQQISGAAVFGLLCVLPLVGFPVTVLHVIAGVRFGPAMGVAAVAASTLIHMVVSYAVVRAVPHMFVARLEKLRSRLPTGAHGPITLFTFLLPGVPYWAGNTVLPLIGVQFWIYMGIGFPLHVIRSVVSVWFGDASDHLTPGRIAILVIYYLVILGCCALSWRWLRKRLEAQPPVASGPMPAG